MSKRILVSVACIALVLPLGYTFSGRLMADPPTPTQNQPVAEEYPDAVYCRAGESYPGAVERGAYPNAAYGQERGYPDPTKVNGEPIPQIQQSPEPSPEVSAVVPVPINPGSPPVPYHGTVVDSPWSSPPGSPKQVGTYTVVSDGKRSILLDTSKGDSWQLIIDNPGSRWQPIAKGVPKGGKTEISWSAAPAGTAAAQPAAPPDAVRLEQSEKHVRRLKEALDLETERSGDLEKSLAEANLEIRRLTDGVFKYRDEVAELKKELREAKKALTARPELSPAQPNSTTEDANPFE